MPCGRGGRYRIGQAAAVTVKSAPAPLSPCCKDSSTPKPMLQRQQHRFRGSVPPCIVHRHKPTWPPQVLNNFKAVFAGPPLPRQLNEHAVDRRACIKQRLDDGCAACRHVSEGRAGGCGQEARHVDVVLHRKGHTPQALARRRLHRVQFPATPQDNSQAPVNMSRSATPKQTATRSPEPWECQLQPGHSTSCPALPENSFKPATALRNCLS